MALYPTEFPCPPTLHPQNLLEFPRLDLETLLSHTLWGEGEDLGTLIPSIGILLSNVGHVGIQMVSLEVLEVVR